MGWAQGTNYKGETVGYSIPTVCEEPGCDEEIDKGLAYCCGELDGVNGEAGCGGYFCYRHLYYGTKGAGQRCGPCLDKEEPEE